MIKLEIKEVDKFYTFLREPLLKIGKNLPLSFNKTILNGNNRTVNCGSSFSN